METTYSRRASLRGARSVLAQSSRWSWAPGLVAVARVQLVKRDIPYGAQWRILVNVVTLIWLVIFASSFAPIAPWATATAGRIGLGLLAIFVADLAVTYYRAAEPPLPFLRHHWLDVLLVIPYFRLFRVLRVVRFLRFLRLLKQPGPALMMRVSKLVLNSVRAGKKGRRAVKEVSVVTGQGLPSQRQKD